MIDDLGVGRDSYKSGRPFIITTNLSLEDLQNPADLEHGRTCDRIMERCVFCCLFGKNYRTDKNSKSMENATGILSRLRQHERL